MVRMFLCLLCLLFHGVFSKELRGNISSRPAVVNVGAIVSFNSTIGRVAKIAIEEAVKDVNSNSSVLPGTRLVVHFLDSVCNAFLGMIGALQFMESDTVAIIGPQSSVVAHSLSYVANEFHVPLLSFAATDPAISSLQFPYFVRTTQSDLYQMTAAAEIVSYYGWKEVIAIFIDDDYGRNVVAALDDALAARNCRISYKAGIPPAASANRSDILDILLKVVMMESRVMVLHAYSDAGFMVFSVAMYLGMMGDGYVWIATDWLSSVLDSTYPVSSEKMDSMQGVLFLRQHTPNSDRKRAFSSRWSKLTGGSLGLNSYALYAYDTVWLLSHAMSSFLEQGGTISFSSDSNLSTLEGSNLRLEVMSTFDGGEKLLDNILQSDFIGLTGHVKFDSDRSLIRPAFDIMNVLGTGFRQIGYWSSYSGLSTVPPETLYSSPPNRSSAAQQLRVVIWPGETASKPRGWAPSNGRQLRIGVPRRASFQEFVLQLPGTNNFKGFCVDVFTAAVNLLPYAVPYQFIPYGDGHQNPSYTGLVNLIAAGVLDGAVGDIAIVTNRTRVVDFTQPFASSGLLVVVPFKKLNSGAWAFLRPFSPELWCAAAFSFLFVGVAVWILEHRSNDDFRGPPKKQLITILWFSLSTLFFSHRENIFSTLGKMVLLIWLFVVLIIQSSYTASLSSFLTVQHLYSPIKGIDSLKDGDERIGYQVGSFAESYLIEVIGIQKSRLVALGSPEDYARELLRGPENGGVAAVVDEQPYIELFLSRHCNFRIVGEEFTKSGWGFAFTRNSPLAVDFSTAILRLSENGDLQRIHDKWLNAGTCSTDDSEINSNRLHLGSFASLFFLCGIACFIAILIHFTQILLRFRGAAQPDSVAPGPSSSRCRSFQQFITFMDKKEEHPSTHKKKRKLERPPSENNDEPNLGEEPKRRRPQISSEIVG